MTDIDCANGILVNVSALGAPSDTFKFSELCLCDNKPDGFSGACDMFDTRVAYYQSKTYSLSCKNSNIATYVIYSLFLLVLIRKLIYSITALVQRIRFRGIQSWRDIYKHTPYLFLISDGLVSTPILMAFCILKLTDTQRVIGTDLSLTVVFVVGVCAGIFTIVGYSYDGFQALVRGQALRLNEEAAKLLSFYKKINAMIMLAYILISAIPRLVMLSLNRSIGPIQNHQVVVLIIGNIGIITWSGLQVLSSYIATKEAEKLLSIVEANKLSSQNVGEIVRYLKTMERKHGLTVGLSFVIYLIACLPWLWAYQMFFFITLLLVSNFVGVIGKIYLETNSIQKQKEQASAPSSNSGKKIKDSKSVAVASFTQQHQSVSSTM